MFLKNDADARSWIRSWPVIITVVAAILGGVHILRVNQPQHHAPSAPNTSYTAEGPLITGRLVIPPSDFHSHRIDLNHTARLSGSYRTPNIRQLVSVIVLTEEEFARWKDGREFQFVVQTGFVPGGKINRVLGAGTYFLIVDNRPNDDAQTVDVEFTLE